MYIRKNNKGEITALILLSTLVIISVTAYTISLVNKSKQTTTTKAASAGACRDNPEAPLAGYRWVADCDKVCDTQGSSDKAIANKDCPKNVGDPSNVNPDSSNWCYGFDTGFRCLMLVREGFAPSQIPPSTPLRQPTILPPTATPIPTIKNITSNPINTPVPTQRSGSVTSTPVPAPCNFGEYSGYVLCNYECTNCQRCSDNRFHCASENPTSTPRNTGGSATVAPIAANTPVISLTPVIPPSSTPIPPPSPTLSVIPNEKEILGRLGKVSVKIPIQEKENLKYFNKTSFLSTMTITLRKINNCRVSLNNCTRRPDNISFNNNDDIIINFDKQLIRYELIETKLIMINYELKILFKDEEMYTNQFNFGGYLNDNMNLISDNPININQYFRLINIHVKKIGGLRYMTNKRIENIYPLFTKLMISDQIINTEYNNYFDSKIDEDFSLIYDSLSLGILPDKINFVVRYFCDHGSIDDGKEVIKQNTLPKAGIMSHNTENYDLELTYE